MKRPLRGALVGFGFIGQKGHLSAYSERSRNVGDVRIVAIADSCEARRLLAAKLHPDAAIYPDHRSLLADGALELDFVDIATPPIDHAAIAHAALDRGLHVLCEKPLATTATAARAMLEHAARARRVLYPCHNYKHAPVVTTVNDIIASGRIGKVGHVTLSTFRNTHARGVPEWRPDWRRERNVSGGGIAMDHGSHTFYLAFDWLGSYPRTITARMAARGAWDTEDDFSCTLDFPNGVAHAHLTWTAGVRKVIYTINGDKGAIRVEDDDLEIAEQRPDPAAHSIGGVTWQVERRPIASHWMDASHARWFNALFDGFKTSIASDEFVGREAREALLCIEVITTAYASAQNGCRMLPIGHGTHKGDGASEGKGLQLVS